MLVLCFVLSTITSLYVVGSLEEGGKASHKEEQSACGTSDACGTLCDLIGCRGRWGAGLRGIECRRGSDVGGRVALRRDGGVHRALGRGSRVAARVLRCRVAGRGGAVGRRRSFGGRGRRLRDKTASDAVGSGASHQVHTVGAAPCLVLAVASAVVSRIARVCQMVSAVLPRGFENNLLPDLLGQQVCAAAVL